MRLMRSKLNLEKTAQEKATDAAERAKRVRARLDFAIRQCLGTSEGRQVLRWIIDDAGYGRSSFNTDPLCMAFAEGRRSVAIGLRERLRSASPDLFRLLEDENHV